MKNTIKLLGLIALVAVIGFTIVACNNGGNPTSTLGPSEPSGGNGDGDGDEDEDEDDGDDNGVLGTTLNLSGQVYTVIWDRTNITFEQFTGNRKVYSKFGGSGSITNGQLSFRFGRPNVLKNSNEMFDWVFQDLNNFSVSPAAARGRFLDLETPDGYLYRGNATYSVTGNIGSRTEERVAYIYVDRDTTISASYTVDSGVDTYSFPYTPATNAFHITLQKGWNALYGKIATDTMTYSLGNPTSLKWVIEEWTE